MLRLTRLSASPSSGRRSNPLAMSARFDPKVATRVPRQDFARFHLTTMRRPAKFLQILPLAKPAKVLRCERPTLHPDLLNLSIGTNAKPKSATHHDPTAPLIHPMPVQDQPCTTPSRHPHHRMD